MLTYTCRECGGTFEWPGPVHPARLPLPKITVCSECRQAEEVAEAERRAVKQRQWQEAERERQWLAICPALYRKTDPGRLPADKLAAVMAWQWGPGGLLLLGPTATGKTRCAYLLLRKLLEADHRVVAFDCMGFGHECSRRFGDGSGEAWIQEIATVDVVFFDDFGKGKFTERVESELFGLVERRTANMLPIIATTNLTGEGLEGKMTVDRAAPLVRRLREFCKQVVFE